MHSYETENLTINLREAITPKIALCCIIGDETRMSETKTEAEKLFPSIGFKSQLQFAERFEKCVIVTSEYGIVYREDSIAPYRSRIGALPTHRRHEKIMLIRDQLAKHTDGITPFVCVASGNWLTYLQQTGFTFIAPCAGMGTMQRARWLRQHGAHPQHLTRIFGSQAVPQ